MRFGLFIPQGWRLDLTEVAPENQWAAMKSLVQHADTTTTPAGHAWESVQVYDHFHTFPGPSDQATHEAWSLMAAFAAASDRVRLGQMCTCMAYREPTYLAKVAATVDIISGGRVEMGIGAGWYEHEWRAYGYGFPTAGQRINALDEGVQIMSAMWHTGNSGTFTGKRYQVDGALCYPQPLQTQEFDGKDTPHIPLWIAGGGEKKTLRVVAQYAQYANIAPQPEAFTHKASVLHSHCEAVGRDKTDITLSANYNIVIGENQAEIDDQYAWLESNFRKHTPDKADAFMEGWRNEYLVGSPEQIVEKLQHMKTLGLDYTIAYFPNLAVRQDHLELFETKVIPELQ